MAHVTSSVADMPNLNPKIMRSIRIISNFIYVRKNSQLQKTISNHCKIVSGVSSHFLLII